ncbi:MAG: adenosylcobyric acid synthase [Glaciecola sp.]|jgi:adenosylcobyric acid synthase
MTAVMVQGCTSWAGKSWVTTALCRWYARQGLSVAPFKAQNMANNARVVDGHGERPGGEIGTAQWLQAMAAGVTPDIRMNPVLVKPETWTSSQVIVDGRVDPAISALPWSDRAPMLRTSMHRALDSLLADFDLVVIEGAGSPAEINLDDQVNMAIAAHAQAPVLLVADIDRGGAFAHLYGTWALQQPQDGDRIKGFILNRFRGDATLLAPGPQELERHTGIPTIGVIPMVEHDLPDEDGGALHRRAESAAQTVGIVRYPTASNLDEYVRMEQVANILWIDEAEQVGQVDLVVLPGSKHPLGDEAWLRQTGVGEAIVASADRGTRILGICGGLQLLGGEIVDGTQRVAGLGLLDASTRMQPGKVARSCEVAMAADLGPAWSMIAGANFTGYEIRQGEVTAGMSAPACAEGTTAVVDGNVLGVLAHGMLEDAGILERLFDTQPTRSLEDTFEALADLVEEHLDTDLLRRLAGLN